MKVKQSDGARKVSHVMHISRTALAGGPPDLAEQVVNMDRIPLREMSAAAHKVFESAWDPALDGCKWPPNSDCVLKGILE